MPLFTKVVLYYDPKIRMEKDNFTYNQNMVTPSVFTPSLNKPVPRRSIRAVAKYIAEKFQPEEIILFGSYAYGKPEPSSDVDLLVVMDTPLKESKISLEIHRHLNVMFGLDLVVYTPKHLKERVDMSDWFVRDILKEGKVLYEADNS